MSPKIGRPPINEKKKSVRIEIRITEKKADQLKACAERLGISRAEVIERGIDLVDAETK